MSDWGEGMSSVFSKAPAVADEPRYVPDLSEGDSVRHKLFGVGTVLDVEGDVATVYFKGKGTRKLDVGYAPIEKL